MHPLTASENKRCQIEDFKREPSEIVASNTSVRVCLHVRKYPLLPMIKTKKNYSGENIRSAIHPIIRKHTETGRMAVYVNELMTEEIIGLPSKESRHVLNEIYLLQKESRFCYEHVWQVGDLIMWDNRCTLHARTDFPSNQRRLLRRVTIEDSAPN